MKHLEDLLNVVVLSDTVFDPAGGIMKLRYINKLLLDN
jgi:hypothetical protein